MICILLNKDNEHAITYNEYGLRDRAVYIKIFLTDADIKGTFNRGTNSNIERVRPLLYSPASISRSPARFRLNPSLFCCGIGGGGLCAMIGDVAESLLSSIVILDWFWFCRGVGGMFVGESGPLVWRRWRGRVAGRTRVLGVCVWVCILLRHLLIIFLLLLMGLWAHLHKLSVSSVCMLSGGRTCKSRDIPMKTKGLLRPPCLRFTKENIIYHYTLGCDTSIWEDKNIIVWVNHLEVDNREWHSTPEL